MKYRFNLILFLTIMFFLTPIACLAKEIKIDGTTYKTLVEKINGEGYSFNPNNNTLTLNNANLKSIDYNDDLSIILEGENYFNSSENTI